ncbi:MAG: MmgE/PrpD family protein, partial [Deltaproteobacteria bacterium]|nr:MmgE/PrpD family protein [Deltaproteobacteria bacterium]
MSEKTIIEELAEFGAGLRFEDIPDEVIRQANRCLIDLMGCYFAAFAIKGNRRLLALASDLNPKPDATIWGMGRKAGMAEAALVHGCLAYHLEYDDGISLGAHWASEAIPAVLAAAEVVGCGGKVFLSAVIVAYEVGNRISRAFSADMLARGIHFPCAMGAFGAAAGVAKIMGLSADETAGALGNGCLSPVAPYGPAFSGASIKDAYSGWPNALGIHMVRLSQVGWSGARDLLESPEGLGHALGWKAPAHELRKKILDGIGKEYEIMKTYFKPYPCCRWLHAPALATIELKRSYGWEAADVASRCVVGPQ